MITLLGYSLHALVPFALVGIPLGSAFLVYVYRSLGDSNKKVVSSLFLLKDLPKGIPGRSKFIPPLQFWIEVLCFLLLALAAAGITAQRQGEHIAIVIDSSLSMSAEDSPGETRLTLAKKQATHHLTQAAGYDRFTVFSAGAALRPASPAEVTTAEAKEAIGKINFAVEQDRLSSILDSIFSRGEYDRVWLYTDHSVVEGDEKRSDFTLKVTSLPSAAVRSAASNIWISDLYERKGDAFSQLKVTVQASSPESIPATLSGSCYGESNQQLLGNIPALPVTLHNDSPSVHSLAPLPTGWKYCKITIVPNAPTHFDALEEDNTAWITSSASGQEILLFSPLSVGALGLDVLKAPKIIPAGKKDSLESSTSILHREAIPLPPPKAGLYILPPQGKFPWGGKVTDREIKNPEITRWMNAHPLLQYLNVPTLVLPFAKVLQCPEAFTPLLFTREGPIACAGETPTGRFVILGFEVLPFDGARSPAASVLLLNIFKWLLQDLALDNRPQPPGYQPIPPHAVQATEISSLKEVPNFDDGGRILLKGSQLIDFKDASGHSIGQVVSLFSSAYESNIRSDQLLTTSPPARQPIKTKTTTSDLWSYFVISALILLAWDLSRKLRGLSRWEGR